MIREEINKIPEKKRKYIGMVLIILACLTLYYAGYKIKEIKECENSGGIYMEDKSCYMPKSEEERQEILEKGYLETCEGYGCWGNNDYVLFIPNTTLEG